MGTWEVGTWYKRMKRSEILKFGTESDVARLPPPSCYNITYPRKYVFNRDIMASNPNNV